MSVHVPVNDVAWFGIHATLHGREVETGSYFRRLSPPITAGNLELEANRIMQAWAFAMVGQLGDDVEWRNVTAIDLTPGSGLSIEVPFFPVTGFLGPSLPGHIAFSLMPLGVTIPRPWQWRFRLFGVPQSVVSGNLINVDWATDMRTLVRDRYTLQGAFGWRCSVVQKVVGGIPLTGGVPYDVTDYGIPTLVVSPMRRRLT